MGINRTTYSEQDMQRILKDAEYRKSVAKQNKQRRFRRSKLDAHKALILDLHERGKSLDVIRLVLSGGSVTPKVRAGRTTIHDYIKRCLTDA